MSFEKRELAYLRDVTPYGEQFAVQQIVAWAPNRVVIGNPATGEMPTPAEVLIPQTPWVRWFDRRLADLLSRRSSAAYGSSVLGARRLAKAVGECDVVYTMFGPNAIEVAGALERCDSAARFAFHAAGSDVTAAKSKPPAYRSRLLRAAERADLVFCGSEFLRGRAMELGFPEEKLRVHYLGVVVPSFDVPDQIERQGAVSAVTAGAQLTLKVIGDGPDRSRLTAIVAEEGIEHLVRFAGVLQRSEVYRELSRADLFLQHNVPAPNGAEEAIGGSILEAGAFGVPVVIARSGGAPEAVQEGVSGIVVEPYDVSSMAEALVELSASPTLRQAMGNAGRRFVSENHNAAIQNAKFVAAIAAL